MTISYFCFRFLAFSPVPIESAVVEIDGKPLNSQATRVQGALFVCQWNPAEFSSGIHSITVKVQVSRQSLVARGTQPVCVSLVTSGCVYCPYHFANRATTGAKTGTVI